MPPSMLPLRLLSGGMLPVNTCARAGVAIVPVRRQDTRASSCIERLKDILRNKRLRQHRAYLWLAPRQTVGRGVACRFRCGRHIPRRKIARGRVLRLEETAVTRFISGSVARAPVVLA